MSAEFWPAKVHNLLASGHFVLKMFTNMMSMTRKEVSSLKYMASQGYRAKNIVLLGKKCRISHSIIDTF